MSGITSTKGFIYGLVFGSLSPIPGISAGTLAVFFNIYEQFFNVFTWENVKKNVPFFVMFAVGSIVGLAGVSNLLMFLMEYHQQMLLFSFKGLIIGCVPMVYLKARTDRINPLNVGVFAISLGIMLFIAFFGELGANMTLEQLGGISPLIITWVFAASFVSSASMLVPGFGGSLAMLVFGIYAIYIEAISTVNLGMLAVFIVSMGLGLWVGIRIIRKLLKTHAKTLYSGILGFVVGSIFIMYPGFEPDMQGLISVVLACVFALLAYRFSKEG